MAKLATWPRVRDRSARNRAGIAKWIPGFPMIPGVKSVADVCGYLAADELRRGEAKATNDMWIAACCLAYELPLATLNVKDFDDFRIHHGLTIMTA